MDQPEVDLHPAAVREARDAREWYEDRNPQLAVDFMEELDEGIEKVGTYPDRWPKYLHGTRVYLLQRFPYVVVYRKISEGVQVVAVAHVKRRPGYWSDRLNADG